MSKTFDIDEATIIDPGHTSLRFTQAIKGDGKSGTVVHNIPASTLGSLLDLKAHSLLNVTSIAPSDKITHLIPDKRSVIGATWSTTDVDGNKVELPGADQMYLHTEPTPSGHDSSYKHRPTKKYHVIYENGQSISTKGPKVIKVPFTEDMKTENADRNNKGPLALTKLATGLDTKATDWDSDTLNLVTFNNKTYYDGLKINSDKTELRIPERHGDDGTRYQTAKTYIKENKTAGGLYFNSDGSPGGVKLDMTHTKYPEYAAATHAHQPDIITEHGITTTFESLHDNTSISPFSLTTELVRKPLHAMKKPLTYKDVRASTKHVNPKITPDDHMVEGGDTTSLLDEIDAISINDPVGNKE
jgi:hypothetical protein